MEEGPWEEDHIWQVESNTDDHLNALAKTLALKFTNQDPVWQMAFNLNTILNTNQTVLSYIIL